MKQTTEIKRGIATHSAPNMSNRGNSLADSRLNTSKANRVMNIASQIDRVENEFMNFFPSEKSAKQRNERKLNK